MKKKKFTFSSSQLYSPLWDKIICKRFSIIFFFEMFFFQLQIEARIYVFVCARKFLSKWSRRKQKFIVQNVEKRWKKKKKLVLDAHFIFPTIYRTSRLACVKEIFLFRSIDWDVADRQRFSYFFASGFHRQGLYFLMTETSLELWKRYLLRLFIYTDTPNTQHHADQSFFFFLLGKFWFNVW